jgi:hypothetical protein
MWLETFIEDKSTLQLSLWLCVTNGRIKLICGWKWAQTTTLPNLWWTHTMFDGRTTRSSIWKMICWGFIDDLSLMMWTISLVLWQNNCHGLNVSTLVRYIVVTIAKDMISIGFVEFDMVWKSLFFSWIVALFKMHTLVNIVIGQKTTLSQCGAYYVCWIFMTNGFLFCFVLFVLDILKVYK